MPGQIRIVPGSFSRSMIFFTAIAAVMFTACPELCPSPWPGAPFDQRVVIRDARLLRRLRNAVDVGPERDHRLARAPGRHERGRNAGDALFDGEAVLLQDVDQVAMRLLLLEAELAVAEDLIDHLLRERRHAVDVGRRLGLEPIDARVDLRGRRGAGCTASCGERRRDDRTIDDHNRRTDAQPSRLRSDDATDASLRQRAVGQDRD